MGLFRRLGAISTPSIKNDFIWIFRLNIYSFWFTGLLGAYFCLVLQFQLLLLLFVHVHFSSRTLLVQALPYFICNITITQTQPSLVNRFNRNVQALARMLSAWPTDFLLHTVAGDREYPVLTPSRRRKDTRRAIEHKPAGLNSRQKTAPHPAWLTSLSSSGRHSEGNRQNPGWRPEPRWLRGPSPKTSLQTC